LRRACKRLARDHVLSRDRPRARLDPDLPIGIGAPEREMLAFDAVHHALADVLGVKDVCHQFVIGVGQEQIGPHTRIAARSLLDLDQGQRRGDHFVRLSRFHETFNCRLSRDAPKILSWPEL